MFRVMAEPAVQKCFDENAAAPQAVFLPAELSPGLAALTVGCHSGKLSSISRVQLLLLDRVEPKDEELWPPQDCFGFRLQDEAGPTFSGKSGKNLRVVGSAKMHTCTPG